MVRQKLATPTGAHSTLASTTWSSPNVAIVAVKKLRQACDRVEAHGSARELRRQVDAGQDF
jgi:hypothetical protein